MLLLRLKSGAFVEFVGEIQALSQEALIEIDRVYVINKVFYVTTKYFLADTYPDIVAENIMPSIE